MTYRTRPQLADPADPRFRDLPYGDDRLRRLLFWSPTTEAVLRAEHLLERCGYIVHRIGAARSACGPNGNRWVFSWQIGDGPVPARAGRLTDLTAAGRPIYGRPGAGQ